MHLKNSSHSVQISRALSCLSIIREYNKTKLKLINDIFNFLNNIDEFFNSTYI